MTEDEMVEWHHPLDGHEFEVESSSLLCGACGSTKIKNNKAADL